MGLLRKSTHFYLFPMQFQLEPGRGGRGGGCAGNDQHFFLPSLNRQLGSQMKQMVFEQFMPFSHMYEQEKRLMKHLWKGCHHQGHPSEN